MIKLRSTIALAFLFTLAVLLTGYYAFGLLPMYLFTFGYLGGFLMWLNTPSPRSYEEIRKPFLLTFALFVLHKVEEWYTGFMSKLSAIDGQSYISLDDSAFIYVLYALIAFWILIPFLIKRGYEFGYYLIWTFFASMGAVEISHFFIPFATDMPYGYFPGMATVVLLAPAAWWGMYRLLIGSITNESKTNVVI